MSERRLAILYAREVIGLMAAFPGREWRMAHIVNHVARGTPQSKQLRNRYRQGIRRVLQALADSGVVRVIPAKRGSPVLYVWLDSECDTK